MTYKVTEKADQFRMEGGIVIPPEILPKGKAVLGLLMLDETAQTRLPKDDMDYLVEQGYLEVVEDVG